jgi:class 3 adenylate cyclase
MSELDEEELSTAIAGLERQRASLGDAVVDPAIAALRGQLSELKGGRAHAAFKDERKLVTIMFVDVSGFTALSEKLDPEKVRELTNACFDWLVPVVQKYGGTIDKFIGDEIMALFGAPVAHEDDAERALRAGLEMMDGIAAFNRLHGTEIGLHLGINTGLVVAGQVGAGGHRDYSVIGDAVNLAARLEDASSTGEIFVGPATYRQTHPLFHFKAVRPLNLKGKEAPVQIYQLLGARAAPKPTRGIEGLRAPLIGRDKEQEHIREAMAELERGKGSVLAIVGEAGLGKSRLIAETRNSLAAGVTWAEGRALSYTAGMSYWLGREIILSLLGVSAEAAPLEIGGALQRSVDVHGQSEVYPYLARLLELTMEAAVEEQVRFLSAETLQARILEALRDYVRSRAKQRPLVLVWEDLHWCDPSSWQVLETLLPLSVDVPLLLVCVSRLDDNRVAEIFHKAKYPCRMIRLTPLTRKESGSLIQQLLHLESFPDRMRELILNRAEGNPFFVEELLRSLIDAGVLVLQEGRATPTREIDAMEIPETLQGVLAARIDRLQPDHKQALQRASVIGRIFQQRVLAHIYGQKYDQNGRCLDASLRELQRKEFIQSCVQQLAETAALEEDEYIFKHAITHDVAYGSMLLSHRRQLHELAAKAIETLFPDRLEELSATLGYHFEKAETAERAAFYLGRAAERARATFANTEAIAFYESAIRQVGRGDDEKLREMGARLNEGLGDVLTLVGRHREAREAFERARSLLAPTEFIWRSRLHRKSGFSYSLQRHYRETAREFDLADLDLGEPEAASADWWEEKVQIQLERMHLFYWQGMVEEMRQVADRYSAVIAERAVPIQRAKFSKILALSMLMESHFWPSRDCVELAKRAVREAEGTADLGEASHVRFALGLIQLWHGNSKQALEQCGEALASAKRIGDLVLQARCLTYRAVAHRRLGDVARASVEAEKTLGLATKLGMVEYVAMSKANLAWAAWRQNHCEEAEKLGLESLQLWRGMENRLPFDWMALWPLIAIAHRRRDVARAIEFAHGLLDQEQQPLPEKLSALTHKAIEEWQNGAETGATSNLVAAVQLATELHYL